MLEAVFRLVSCCGLTHEPDSIVSSDLYTLSAVQSY